MDFDGDAVAEFNALGGGAQHHRGEHRHAVDESFYVFEEHARLTPIAGDQHDDARLAWGKLINAERARNTAINAQMKLFVDQSTANVVKTVEKINYELVGPGEQLLIAPHWPGLYAILNRKSPLWDTYFLFPASSNAQLEMIKELERQNTNWVILGDVPLDGRDDLRFKSLYLLVWEHFKGDFQPIEIEGLPKNYQLLKRNNSPD